MPHRGETPRLVTGGRIVERLGELAPPGRVLLVRTHAHHYPRCERVLVAIEHQDRVEEVFDGWMEVPEAEGLYRLLSDRWRVSWAECDCQPEGPWTVIWTLGPLPLRVWSRSKLRLESDGETVWGAFAERRFSRSDVVAVEATSRWLGVRCAVVLRTRTKSFEVHGVLCDVDDDRFNHWAIMLAGHIQDVLRL